MKIVFSIPHISLGGAQRVVITLIRWLQQNTDNEIFLLIINEGTNKGFIYDIHSIPHAFFKGNYFRKILVEHKLLKRLNPDILVSFGVPNTLFDTPATFCMNLKTVVCERNDPAHFGGRAITRIFSRLLMRKANGFVFQTQDAQVFYGGEIAKRSVVIPNPLFIGDDYPTTQYIGEREKTIVTTGRLNKQKNHPLLIRAFKRIAEEFPEYKLIIYGEGPERQNDEALIQELGLQERVLLPGTINDVPDKIYKASLYVLSSDFEGMPNALMEAMALGLPCISTDCPCGGPRELTTNGEDCLLVPVGDEIAIAEAMRKVLSEEKFAMKLGKNAMKIRDKLSLDKVCKQWYEYFKTI